MPGRLDINAAIASACLLAFGGSAEAASNDPALLAAFDLCLEIPEDIEDARKTLRSSGWESTEDAAMLALFNGVAVFNFRANDLDYTFSNANFMAASVLGNSALGRDQIGMRSGEHTLAVLGIPEGTPYCIITGSDALLETLAQDVGFKDQSSTSSDLVTQISGRIQSDIATMVGKFDVAKLTQALSEAELPDDKKIRITELINPVTIHTVHSEVDQ